MNKGECIKRGLAWLLSAVMVSGVVPGTPGAVSEVQAATVSTPSVYTFATKSQLMNNFDLDGKKDTVGTITFGKDYDGEDQYWYIAGKDSKVSGDNIILFAESPFLDYGQVFENDPKTNKKYQTAWGCTYTTAPKKVYPNHYGASDLRAKLQSVLKDSKGNVVTKYFSKAEQKLMNSTTIKTYDVLNKVNYKTKDKLYLLQGNYDKDTAYAGSDDSIKIAGMYWGHNEEFWSRTPDDDGGQYGWTAWHYDDTDSDIISRMDVDDDVICVKPAFDLNLSSVLFASEAYVPSSPRIAYTNNLYGWGMTLRLDGSSQSIGSAVYYDSASRVVAQKDANVSGTVTLVVQGKEGKENWYYSKPVTGTTVITGSEIKKALRLSSDVSLKKCKIWVERTIGGMAYAKMATAGTLTQISSVSVAGITAPAGGQAFDTAGTSSTTGLEAASKTPGVTWT